MPVSQRIHWGAAIATSLLVIACNPEVKNPAPKGDSTPPSSPPPVKRTVPAPLIPDEAGIEPRIRSVDGDTPGEFSITYEWALARPLAEDWRVFVHFTDAEGKIVFQNDHDPERPTSQWMPGTIRQGPRRVKLPVGFAGTVEIRMGLYDADKGGEGSRGRATLDGPADGEKRIHVGRLEVTEGKTTFIPLP